MNPKPVVIAAWLVVLCAAFQLGFRYSYEHQGASVLRHDRLTGQICRQFWMHGVLANEICFHRVRR